MAGSVQPRVFGIMSLSQILNIFDYSSSLQLLSTEQDLTTKRNAFQVLCRYAQPKALNYLLSHIESVAMWGDILQMAALELIRKVSIHFRPTLCSFITHSGSFAHFATSASPRLHAQRAPLQSLYFSFVSSPVHLKHHSSSNFLKQTAGRVVWLCRCAGVILGRRGIISR